eukprot:scaffold111781_cov35-Tisochrysis_lutea.AAC.3
MAMERIHARRREGGLRLLQAHRRECAPRIELAISGDRVAAHVARCNATHRDVADGGQDGGASKLSARGIADRADAQRAEHLVRWLIALLVPTAEHLSCIIDEERMPRAERDSLQPALVRTEPGAVKEVWDPVELPCRKRVRDVVPESGRTAAERLLERREVRWATSAAVVEQLAAGDEADEVEGGQPAVDEDEDLARQLEHRRALPALAGAHPSSQEREGRVGGGEPGGER